MSDNWNLLAKLLGTPGPPEPPKPPKSEEPAKPPTDDKEKENDLASRQADSSDSGAGESAAFDLPPVAEAVTDVDQDRDSENDPSAAEVLEALSTEAAKTRLPGFGARPSDPRIDELTAGAPPMVEQPVVDELLVVDSTVSQSDRLFSEEGPVAEQASDEGTDSIDDPNQQPDDAVWSELADELGIDANEEPPPHRAPVEIKPVRREVPPVASEKITAGRFGDGLGIDLGPEPVEQEAEQEVDEVELFVEEEEEESVSESFGSPSEPAARNEDRRAGRRDNRGQTGSVVEKSMDPPDPLSFRSFSDLDDDSEEDFAPASPDVENQARDRESSERSPRRRGGQDRDAAEQAPRGRSETPRGRGRAERDNDETSSSDRPALARGEDSESRPRRRGRRGQRQQMSEDSIGVERSPSERPERIRPEPEEPVSGRDDDDSHGRSRSRRRGGSRPPRERSPQDAVEALDDENDVEFVEDDFGFGLVTDDSDSDSDSDSELRSDGEANDSGPRRRRRGRRGRGGRSRTGSAESGASESEDTRPAARERGDRGRGAADEPRTDDDFDDEPIPASAFDDDHEDDDEVEVIRRGRRRRGRRGGRGRTERESESNETEELGARSGDDEDQEDAPPRRGPRRRPVEAESDARDEEPRKRKIVPTWQEVVNILVDNNLENHKRAPKGQSQGRGRGRRR
jgi:hypothetical protein